MEITRIISPFFADRSEDDHRPSPNQSEKIPQLQCLLCELSISQLTRTGYMQGQYLMGVDFLDRLDTLHHVYLDFTASDNSPL